VNVEQALSLIRTIPDYPKPGILFQDITPVLSNPEAFNVVVRALAQVHPESTVVAGIEARGFIYWRNAGSSNRTHKTSRRSRDRYRSAQRDLLLGRALTYRPTLTGGFGSRPYKRIGHFFTIFVAGSAPWLN